MTLIRRDRQFPWLTISIVAHVVGLALLYHFTPLREMIIPERREKFAEPNVSERQLQDVQQQIQDRLDDQLKLRLEELKEIEKAMDEVQKVKDEAYEEMAKEESENALEVAQARMREALEKQRTALAQQTAQREALPDILGEVDAFLKKHEELAPVEANGKAEKKQ